MDIENKKQYAITLYESMEDKREATFTIYVTLINLIPQDEVLDLFNELVNYYSELDYYNNIAIIRAIYEMQVYKDFL